MKLIPLLYVAFAATIAVITLPGIAQEPPYQDPSLTPQQRARDLVDRLSLEEKASLMLDESQALPQLGIRKFNWWSEALHGLPKDAVVYNRACDLTEDVVTASMIGKASMDSKPGMKATYWSNRQREGAGWKGRRCRLTCQVSKGAIAPTLNCPPSSVI